MTSLLVALLLACCATLGHAGSRVRPCTIWETDPPALAADERGGPLKVVRCSRYTDATGSYKLYLLGSQERPFGWWDNDTMSTRLAVQLFRKTEDGLYDSQWLLRDRSEPAEAGGWFATQFLEFADLDGTGTLTPIVAIRYWSFDPAEPGEPAFVADVGRLKFLFVDGKAPVVVHATTGHAERDRRIVATPSFFDLPAAHQRYLADKMRKIHAHDVFVFDATNQFLPRRQP